MSYVLDTSTEFLFGESVNSQLRKTGDSNALFVTAFASITGSMEKERHSTGWLFPCREDHTYDEAIRNIHTFVDKHVERALAQPPRTEEDKSLKRYVLLHEMAQNTRDKLDLRHQILQIFLLAHESTAILLSEVFFELARQPRVWHKLRAEVLRKCSSDPSYESVKAMRYLRHVINEGRFHYILAQSRTLLVFSSLFLQLNSGTLEPTLWLNSLALRMYPLIDSDERICLRDVVLPLDSGPGGKAPIMVRKGQLVGAEIWALHRDKIFWGEDANEFIPERWETAQPMWEYLPFKGGPRVCPPQQMVLAEAGYVIARLVQKFAQVERRDPVLEWQEELVLSVRGKNGVKVGMMLT